MKLVYAYVIGVGGFTFTKDYGLGARNSRNLTQFSTISDHKAPFSSRCKCT